MAELFLRKTPSNRLIPIDQEGEELIKSYKDGQDIRCKITKARNVKFHRKYFALLNHAFDCFEPTDIEVPAHISAHGITPEKNFERFRKDLTILAGFYDATIRVNGEIRMEAKSIAFGSMKQEEFDELYSKTIDVILRYILKNYEREELELVVDEIMGFV